MHQEHGLQFRAYVPALMELLEDADGMVREVAKSTVIELFRYHLATWPILGGARSLLASRNAPNAAKSDLKKQLKNFRVRPAIEQAIVKELNPTGSGLVSQTESLSEPLPSQPTLAASVSSLAERPVTPMLDNRPDQVEPLYVNTQRELEEILREMHFHFDGKETEQNWLKREESIIKLRRLIAGNAATNFSEPFLSGLRALLDGIIKAVTSLRTSLSKEGCSLVQDMARAYGPAMDPMVELLMQTFVKLTAATKKISSQLANATVDAIISRVTYNARLMQHIWLACQDKNVQPRLYASGWLKTLLNKEANHKNHVEHTGGLDLIEKCIKKGLGDANPGVREKMRATYWTFANIWPARAEAILNGLDPTAAKLLQNDPHNPNPPKKSEVAARPGLGLSKSTMGTSKPSLRETMLAQKRAIASKTIPPRPGSAMSHFSPVRTVSGTSQASSSTTTSTVRTRPESVIGSTGGLSGAPVRPGRRRPEVAARPATAGPYSVRSHDQPSTEQSSPPDLRRTKAVTPKPIASSPKRTVPKTARPGQVAGANEPQAPTPTKVGTPKAFASPRATPTRITLPPSSSSPSKADEEFTLIVPTLQAVKSPPQKERPSTPRGTASPAPSPSNTPSRIPHLGPALPPALLETAAPIGTTPTPAGSPMRTVEPASAAPTSPTKPLEVYEDPSTADHQATPQPTFNSKILEDRPINEDAATLQEAIRQQQNGEANGVPHSPERGKQNARLLDSGIAKVQQKSLDVHGFRKLQGIIRDSKTTALLTDDRFDALVSGLFAFLESPLSNLAPEKSQDVKAQILATIKLLLKKMRDNFRPHVSRSLESLVRARATYEGRTHMVSGLELLATDLVALGDPAEMVTVLTRMLAGMDVDGGVGGAGGGGNSAEGRSLSMGMHILREMLDSRAGPAGYVPSEGELQVLAGLAARCLESLESAVRMDAVLLCVAIHARVGDAKFWEAVKGVRDDPKSLIMYYITKRQREMGAAAAAAGLVA
jgi:CLIP-associating protein 1/2